MSHVTKFTLKVILARIKPKLERKISEEQYGFMKDKNTTTALYIMRNTCVGNRNEKKKKKNPLFYRL